ncbi:hypothetical protein BC937DRAFT_94353 [Endogone sp. FLAS-F59071]|nr:hypothetical protein BC937DRAFT_94353 [Endogone sp. FLAS-F59071]|eukprot:RUS20805.1 hypothetical protein BC937DRAFT_94353 [Endogone sp. FLAS-F59071]
MVTAPWPEVKIANTHLEQWPDINIKPEICETRSDDLGAAIVTVLSHLGDKQTRSAAMILGELFHEVEGLPYLVAIAVFSLVGPRDNA